MNLVSRLGRRRRSKNTRTKSGLIRVNFFVADFFLLALVAIIIATLILYYCQNPNSNSITFNPKFCTKAVEHNLLLGLIMTYKFTISLVIT